MLENLKYLYTYIYITNDPKSLICSKLLLMSISKWFILVISSYLPVWKYFWSLKKSLQKVKKLKIKLFFFYNLFRFRRPKTT